MYDDFNKDNISVDVFSKFSKRMKSRTTTATTFDVHKSVHRDRIMKVTNKMQLYSSFKSSKTQPAATWVNITRYCNYRQVLLMMGENIARNT
jgi:hypothetical protein